MHTFLPAIPTSSFIIILVAPIGKRISQHNIMSCSLYPTYSQDQSYCQGTRAPCQQTVDVLYLHILCQVVHMCRKHIVGSVHRRGQQNKVFAMLVGLAKQFEAYWSQFFDDIIICCTYKLLRCLYLQIWRFLRWWQTTDKTDCFYPLRMCTTGYCPMARAISCCPVVQLTTWPSGQTRTHWGYKPVNTPLQVLYGIMNQCSNHIYTEPGRSTSRGVLNHEYWKWQVYVGNMINIIISPVAIIFPWLWDNYGVIYGVSHNDERGHGPTRVAWP